MNNFLVKEKMAEFLKEDFGIADLNSIWLPQQEINGYFIAKEDGIICGQQIPSATYELLGNATYTPLIADGSKVTKGTKIGQVKGLAASVLGGERVILNLLQRMSAIATKTHYLNAKLNDPTIKLTDTRKTLPGLRMFDKYAVNCGGGHNHRFDLTGAIMLKDNHIAACGHSIATAVACIRQKQGPLTPIEVEVETKEQLLQAIAADVEVIMFDNQPPEVIKEWKKLVPEHIKIEASGGINAETLPQFKGCGADFLSLGCLTNEVAVFDISFLLTDAIKADNPLTK